MRALRLVVCLGLWASPTLAQTIAITHATVHTSIADEPLRGATIVIRDGRIAGAGTALAVPAGARVIDAAGRIVTVGLMASETALGLNEVSAVEATVDTGIDKGAFGPSFDIQYALNADSTLLPHVRADGLTRAITAPTSSAELPFSGQGAALRLVAGPDIVDRAHIAMFARVGGRSAEKSGGSRAAQWLTIRRAFDELRGGNMRDDARLLQAHDARALKPVLDGKMPLAIAAAHAADIRQAIALAAEYRVRVIILGGEESWRVAAELAAARIPVVLDPSLDQFTSFDNIGARAETAALLNEAGVLIAFNSSAGRGTWDAGAALREGAGFAVAAGLPWAAALKAMTSNPARIWGLADHYGSIAPGQDADLVIWDGDPLEVTTAPVNIFVRGQEVSLVTRATLLRDRYSPIRPTWPGCDRDGCQ